MTEEQEYYWPKIGDQLSFYQPNLEYKNDNGIWVQSGVLTSKLSASKLGRYRVRLNNV